MSNCYRLFVPADKITSGGQSLYIRRQLPSGVLEYKLWSSMLWEADDAEPSPNVYVYFCSIYEYFTTDYRYGLTGATQAIPEITYEIISTGCSTDADVANNYFYTTNLGQNCSNPIGFTRYYAANKFLQPAYTADYIWALYTNTGFTGSKLNNGTNTTIGFGKTQYAANPTWTAAVNTTGTFSGITECFPTTTTTTTLPPCPGTYYPLSLGFNATSSSSACAATPSTIYGNGSNFSTSSKLYSNTACTYATTGYYSDGNNYKYWNASTYQLSSAGACSLLPTTTTSTTTEAPTPTTQPSGMVLARSPIMYRFDNLNPLNYSKFYLYIGTETPSLYMTIERVPDLNLGITIDVSTILMNYMRSNFLYDYDNIVYFYSKLEEYNGSTLISTQLSDTCAAAYGYNSVFNGVFNYSVAEYTICKQIQPNSPFSIPTDLEFKIPIKYNGSMTWTTWYIDTSGTTRLVPGVYMNPLVYSYQEIYHINCGYTILPDVDTRMPITVQIGSDYYTLSPDSCSKNERIELTYINKWGAWDKFYCSGRRDDEMTINHETYKYNRIDYSTMTYDSRKGSYHKLYIQGKERMILNTNWLDENKNEQFKELLLSEVLLIDNVPYIITDKEAKFKTNNNDKIINYTITLEKAYDVINNIR